MTITPGDEPPSTTTLTGSLVSSIHRLKDPTEEQEGAYFVFPDISVKQEGSFKLAFSLFEMRNGSGGEQHCEFVASTSSDEFVVVDHKNWTGLAQSTNLTRAFAEQGVKIRIRKEPKTLLKRKGPADDDYQPRSYKRNPSKDQADKESNTGAGSQQSPTDDSPLSNHTFPIFNNQHRQEFSEEPAENVDPSLSSERLAKRGRTSSEQDDAPFLGYGPPPQFEDDSRSPLSQIGRGRSYQEQSQTTNMYQGFEAQQSQNTDQEYGFNQSPQSSHSSRGEVPNLMASSPFLERNVQFPFQMGASQGQRFNRPFQVPSQGFGQPRPLELLQPVTLHSPFSSNIGPRYSQASLSLHGRGLMGPPAPRPRLSNPGIEGYSLGIDNQAIQQDLGQDFSAGNSKHNFSSEMPALMSPGNNRYPLSPGMAASMSSGSGRHTFSSEISGPMNTSGAQTHGYGFDAYPRHE